MTAYDKLYLDDVAARVVEVFPKLDPGEQRVSLELYRLLAEGQGVARAALAERAETSVETVNRILSGWPGVFSDPEGRIVGYWGLAIPAAYASQHRFTIGGRTLSAWCAWDTLFLPQLLGQTAEVESASPAQGGEVRLIVTPEGVVGVDPEHAQMSFILPDATGIQKDVLTTFCHFVHFFPSRQIGESWTARHPGTFMLALDEAHYLARRKNEVQYQRRIVPPSV